MLTTKVQHAGLTPDQQQAIDRAAAWFADPKGGPNFLLDGAAGTGKTFCLQQLLDHLDTNFVLFTAPTNKAVKVLTQVLARAGIHAPCMTIYSALNLRMMPDGAVKVLQARESKERVNWQKYRLVVLDEASMVGQVLLPYITNLQQLHNVRFLFVGDSAQLPPVGEAHSAVMGDDWLPTNHASLTTMMRQDNQILTLATSIREQVFNPIPRVSLRTDNDSTEGVWHYGSPMAADRAILTALDQGLFSQPAGAKCIAWRNVVVDKLNNMIRQHLFPDTEQRFVEGDRVIVTTPFSELLQQPGETEDGMITTDTEGRVEFAELCPHPWYPDFICWRLSVVADEDSQFLAYVLADENAVNKRAWLAKKNALAAEAKQESRKWKQFWEFVEAFHGLRHGYAITAHRSQGSTYEQAFVNFSDMLLNRNRTEAFRCLYVACSRPRKQLHLW